VDKKVCSIVLCSKLLEPFSVELSKLLSSKLSNRCATTVAVEVKKSGHSSLFGVVGL